jgi:two-component system response regulator
VTFLSDLPGGAAVRRILVVEDSSDDLFFLQRALEKCGVQLPVDVVTDGNQALAYLGQALQHARPEAIPCLALLDLKLPRRSGFDILEWMSQRPEFAYTLKVVLTGSQEERDVRRAFSLGADAYVPKPIEVEDLKQILAALADGSWKARGGVSSGPLPGLKMAAA